MTTSANTCPTCDKPSHKEFKPFCSERCQQADLGRWFSGRYAVPGEPVDPHALEESDDFDQH